MLDHLCFCIFLPRYFLELFLCFPCFCSCFSIFVPCFSHIFPSNSRNSSISIPFPRCLGLQQVRLIVGVAKLHGPGAVLGPGHPGRESAQAAADHGGTGGTFGQRCLVDGVWMNLTILCVCIIMYIHVYIYIYKCVYIYIYVCGYVLIWIDIHLNCYPYGVMWMYTD